LVSRVSSPEVDVNAISGIAAAFTRAVSLLSIFVFCMKTGIIKFFNEAKGYGFVTDDETKEDFFVHVTGLNGATVQQNDRVEFETQEGRKGINAVNVRKI
jgi:CspA family cold shock protein